MKDHEIDEALRQAASGNDQVDPALLDGISASIRSDLRPVRPLPPVWILASGLVLISFVTALVDAVYLGLFGIQKLSAAAIALIFPALIVFAIFTAVVSVHEMTPGSRYMVGPAALLAIGSAALIAVFVGVFSDHSMDYFVSQGIACLSAGMLCAIPAGLAGWLILRRGFAVSASNAGLAAGTIAGLAGTIMLELHCPNFRVMHVSIWHVAVIPISGVAGAILARVFQSKRDAIEQS